MIVQEKQNASKRANNYATLPLGDKTPKPNRQSLSLFTPGPRSEKPTKSFLSTIQDENDVKLPSQPPSATRKKLRSPRISNNFQTPITKGDHWDVSDVSIMEELPALNGPNDMNANESDDSEPEYMPPRVVGESGCCITNDLF